MKAWKTILAAGAIAWAVAFSPHSAQAQIPLGINITETPSGIIVTGVLPGGIADRCMPRLRPGARLITVNGDPITSAVQFQQIVLSSTDVKFEFIDPKGERRWAVAWGGRRVLPNCGP
jgi:S1-C subfamily serine protease